MVGDMIVNLYQKDLWRDTRKYNIKRIFPSDKERLMSFIKKNFSDEKGWLIEAEHAWHNGNVYVAVECEKIIGFACYDSSGKGYFGPFGVNKDYRSKGVGTELFYACLDAMKNDGYGYAIIGWVADKEDDELFYANHEFLRMTGYKNMDELFRLAKKSFRNLIREDEQQKIESSIWEQIDSGNENDYIHFHLRKADGSYLSVLDHGRIVNSQQYGRVFYVLFTDWEDMHIHYGDKFSK